MIPNELVNEFFRLLAIKSSKVTYGYDSLASINENSVKTLLICERVEGEKAIRFLMRILSAATLVGIEPVFVSCKTREGNQLFDFGGVATILKGDDE